MKNKCFKTDSPAFLLLTFWQLKFFTFARVIKLTAHNVKEILHSNYSRLFMLGLLAHLICAWFSNGYIQVDEHYQILEFSDYMMGHVQGWRLPWEFQDMIRATLLPDIAFLFAKSLDLLGIYNPFLLVFLLRLCTAIAAWYITCRISLLLAKHMQTPRGEKLFILMSQFLWFVPVLNVRFSSENISAITLLYGLYFILRSVDNPRFTSYFIAGLFFGFSCFLRIQIAFAIAGFVLWLLLLKKVNLKYIIMLALSAALVVGFNFLLDCLFYKQIVFTPAKYFYSNIIMHKAAEFGVNPWWYFITMYIMKAIPPLSVILLGMFAVGVYKNLKNVAVWTILPFLLVHFFIGHKELRFLYPVTFLFIYVAALGLDYLLTKKAYLKLHPSIYTISAIVSIPLLAGVLFTPMEVSINYARYLYHHITPGNNTVFVLNDGRDNRIFGRNTNFYKLPVMSEVFVDSTKDISWYLQKGKIDSAYCLSKSGLALKDSIKGYKITRVYCYFPEWILKCNINDWEGRTAIWSIHLLTRVK